MSTTYTLPHAPTFQLTVLDDSDKPERDWRWEQEAKLREKAHKAAARLVKAKTSKTKPTALPSPDVFPRSAGMSDAVEYERNMGRPWADPQPVPADFGGPVDLPYPQPLSRYYAPTRAEKKRDAEADRQAHAEWCVLDDAYHAAMDTWKLTDGYALLRAAQARHHARQEQFSYNPRKRNAKDVLAKAIVHE